MELNLKNRTYDFLNAIALHVLPAGGALYFGLAEIWGLQWAAEVVGTITVISTFLGVVIRLAKRGWKADGVIQVGDEESSLGFTDGKQFQDFDNNQVIQMKIQRE